MRGYTLVELLVALGIAALVMLGLARAVHGGLAGEAARSERAGLAASAQFALERMASAVRSTTRLILPPGDNPGTVSTNEAVREQRVPPQPGKETKTAVLVVALDHTLDRDADGTPDADNDGDGRYDEDHGGDSTPDGHSGVEAVDDDNDGTVDEKTSFSADDDDEGGWVGEDPVNGVDDEGDGSIDEDPSADMNGDFEAGVSGVDDDGDGSIDEGSSADDDEDGQINEDGLDPVVFRLVGSTLVERVPLPWDEDGDGSVNASDYLEQPLAEGVTDFRVERVSGGRKELVDLTLELAAPGGATLRLTTRQRVGDGS